MDTPEPTESADPVVPIPGHLLPTILDVVERQIEFAADQVWDTKTRDRIVAAVHLWEATVAGTLTAAQTVTVVDLAIAWIEPMWPKNAQAASNVAKLLEEARELIACVSVRSRSPTSVARTSSPTTSTAPTSRSSGGRR